MNTPNESAGELLPCPFCGGDEMTHQSAVGQNWIVCERCLATSPGMHSHEEAASVAWNTRAAPSDAQGVEDDWAALADECGFSPCVESRQEFVKIVQQTIAQASASPVAKGVEVTDEMVKAALGAHNARWIAARAKIEAQGIEMDGAKTARLAEASMRAALMAAKGEE